MFENNHFLVELFYKFLNFLQSNSQVYYLDFSSLLVCVILVIPLLRKNILVLCGHHKTSLYKIELGLFFFYKNKLIGKWLNNNNNMATPNLWR